MQATRTHVHRSHLRLILMAGVVLFTALAAVALWTKSRDAPPPAPSPLDWQEVSLPPATTRKGLSLAEALSQRRSRREFADRPVSREAVAQLCWAAQGITAPDQGGRTAPSAGALYPLTVFVVDASGVSEYDPQRHALLRTVAGDVRGQLQAAALGQGPVGAAPLCLVLTMDVSRAAPKYGSRAERYCLLEAGHVAQNVLLQATALGLVSVPVGAMEEDQVAATLRLPAAQRPVYLLPVGHPRPA